MRTVSQAILVVNGGSPVSRIGRERRRLDPVFPPPHVGAMVQVSGIPPGRGGAVVALDSLGSGAGLTLDEAKEIVARSLGKASQLALPEVAYAKLISHDVHA